MPHGHSSLAIAGAGVLAIACACACDPKPEPELTLRALRCGNVTINDLSILTPGANQGVQRQLANSCFLVEHSGRYLLWDTGLPDGLGPDPVTVLEGAFTLSVTDPLLPQLREIGLQPQDVDFLALSHFHEDHTGNANAFTDSTLLIQRPEFEAAFGPQPQNYGFVPETYAGLANSTMQVLEGRHDVFGDGSVLLLPAPGHTPGHQVLFVDLPNTGPVVLSGDLYHLEDSRRLESVPSFNADPEASRRSMATIEAFLNERGAKLWIQHDHGQSTALRYSPEVYD